MKQAVLASELGRRLREIRVEAGLSQLEVAQRMAITQPKNRNLISRLEHGRVSNPTVLTLSRFLRACGARWDRLNTVLDNLEIPAAELPPDQLSKLPKQDQERARASTERQVRKCSLALPDQFHRKPVTPERQKQAKQRFANYRVVANLIGAAIKDILRKTHETAIAYPFYHAVGRHLLGLLWRQARTARGRQALTAAEPGVPASIGRKINDKEACWSHQRLDLDLVAQVQATVLTWFQEIMKSNPELLPDLDSGSGSATIRKSVEGRTTCVRRNLPPDPEQR